MADEEPPPEEAPPEEAPAEEAPPPPPEPEPEPEPAKEEEPAEEKPKIKRIQVRPGYVVTDADPEDSVGYLSCLPLRPQTAEKYKPILYTFRVPNVTAPSIKNAVARRLPFHVQLDSTVAVIWSLISKEESPKPLGIAQLQWALAFLKAIHNRFGEHPKDVEFLIEAIENNLLEEYAELIDELDIIEDFACSCIPATCINVLETRELPFSVNYSEMVKYSPQTGTSSSYRVPSMTEEELNQELENIKQAAGVTSLDKLDTVSREKAIDFLSAWKKDQIEKIQAEIERLKSIENLLKNIDNERFDGTIDKRQFEAMF